MSGGIWDLSEPDDAPDLPPDMLLDGTSTGKRSVMTPSSGVYGSNDSCNESEGSLERMGALKKALMNLEKQ